MNTIVNTKEDQLTFKNKVDPINALRVVAMLLVFFQHALSYSKDIGFDIDSFGFFGLFWQSCAWGGVWIFFILSGYLIGKGFVTKRYSTQPKGILKFYISRFLKVGIPTYIIAFLISVIDRQTFFADNPKTLINFLTFTYNGVVGVSGIGALWYVSTLMQLYLLSPFVYMLMEKILARFSKNKKRTVRLIITLLIAAEGIYRFSMLWIDVSWYEFVYTPFFGNLDLFVSGMLLNYLTVNSTEQERENRQGKSLKIWAIVALSVAVFVGCLSCYYNRMYYFYIAACPVIFLLAVLFYLYAFDYKRGYRFAKPTVRGIIKNPFTFVNFLSDISFEFYVLHISVIYHVVDYIHSEHNTVIHLKLILITGFLTVIISYFLKKVFQGIRLYPSCLSDISAADAGRSALIFFCIALGVSGLYLWARLAEADIELEGKGSRDEPYLISNAEDLKIFGEAVDGGDTFKGIYFQMTANIDMSGITDFSPIGSEDNRRSFNGHFDGNGYIIENLKIEGDEEYTGFFVNTSGAVISNLGIESGEISGEFCGAIVSYGSGAIVNCYNKADVSGERTGGIADEFEGNVINSWNAGELASRQGKTGIATYEEEKARLEHCYTTQRGVMDNSQYIAEEMIDTVYFAKLLNVYITECEEYDLVSYKNVKNKTVFSR